MDFDAIVVGGGHAGIEAAVALARLKFQTLLVTQNLDMVGKLSCNPAVGGLAKGTIVREIDALGGQMARLIDASMIQFRLLNRSRGPAVQAPRAQADRSRYAQLARELLEKEPSLHLFQDTVVDLILDTSEKACQGVVTERGQRFFSKVTVLTTGTFMGGTIFIGKFSQREGRLGEPGAIALGSALRRRGYRVNRLKTGTSPRVALSSINTEDLQIQKGDPQVLPFSFSNEQVACPNIPCYITATTPETHKIIRDNIDHSPLFAGLITGKGPRYCPSIEDKVMNFPERPHHQIFVEPEGEKTQETYLNGISTSLPESLQERFLRTIHGLEEVRIMRPGYAVEYDFIDPMQLSLSLESKLHRGLFIAGQTNGTSGYEEAACQGIIAGLNAALRLLRKPPLILDRSEAYTAVLIDDLVSKGSHEPYRMFTSRAEYRLCLRQDNADRRLFHKTLSLGIHDPRAVKKFHERAAAIEEVKELLEKRTLKEGELSEEKKGDLGKSLATLLQDPRYTIEDFIEILPELEGKAGLLSCGLDLKYKGYLDRQTRQVKRFLQMEKLHLPSELDYFSITGLSAESREKLDELRPHTIGQASRISGVRSSDVAILLVVLKKMGSKHKSTQ